MLHIKYLFQTSKLDVLLGNVQVVLKGLSKNSQSSPVTQSDQLIIPSPGLCLRAVLDENEYAKTVNAPKLPHVL